MITRGYPHFRKPPCHHLTVVDARTNGIERVYGFINQPSSCSIVSIDSVYIIYLWWCFHKNPEKKYDLKGSRWIFMAQKNIEHDEMEPEIWTRDDWWFVLGTLEDCDWIHELGIVTWVAVETGGVPPFWKKRGFWHKQWRNMGHSFDIWCFSYDSWIFDGVLFQGGDIQDAGDTLGSATNSGGRISSRFFVAGWQFENALKTGQHGETMRLIWFFAVSLKTG